MEIPHPMSIQGVNTKKSQLDTGIGKHFTAEYSKIFSGISVFYISSPQIANIEKMCGGKSITVLFFTAFPPQW